MMSRLYNFLTVGLALLFAFALASCSGGNSSNESAGGGGGAGGLVPQSFNEDCAICHRATSIADVEVVNKKESC